MDGFFLANNGTCKHVDPTDPKANGQQNQIYVQLVLSLALGLSAFFGFCVSALHRQEQPQQSSDLDSFFAHDGKAYMQHGRGRANLQRVCPNSPILSLDGCPCCTK
jgi:hypothetical protein